MEINTKVIICGLIAKNPVRIKKETTIKITGKHPMDFRLEKY